MFHARHPRALLIAALITAAAPLVPAHAQLPSRGPCPADINGDDAVSVQDIFDFLNAYFAAAPKGDFSGNGQFTTQDLFDFLGAYFASPAACPPRATLSTPIVFVSRQTPASGTIYWSVPRAAPGVGAHGRVRPAAPGSLIVREADGTLRTLIDGNNPTAASLNLIDVNGPNVSYDGQRIVFAGLPARPGVPYNTNPVSHPGAWRIYAINADGTGLQQLTFSDQNDLSLAQFSLAAENFGTYDDFDPVFLPDGRICFSSTRYYQFGQYSGVRASNLHIINADGSGLHRITTDRNGADRAMIDPVTGRIVYSRWWRNHRFPIDDMTTITTEVGPAVYGYVGPAYERHLGLTDDRNEHPDMFRNFWQIASINPDGSDVEMFSGRFRDEPASHTYGGAFDPQGDYYSNFFPMFNMTEAAGFGGIRRYTRGPQPYQSVIGVQGLTLDYVNYSPEPSYGVFWGNYAMDPEVLPDGRLLIAWAPDIYQDYGLYTINPDGSNLTKLIDFAATTETRARVLAARPLPPIAPDAYRDNPAKAFPSRLPPTAAGPYDQDGTFTFHCLNVYANAPVDTDIVSAPAAGSASSIRFFIDQQRTSPGSFGHIDWPILLGERAVEPDGSILEPAAPANAPLFEQLRSALADGYRVPPTGGPYPSGMAHVAGMNFAPAGAVATCVGCHAGHTQIAIPANPDDAKFTNLAPGATLTVSSARDPNYTGGLIDRRVMKGAIWQYWNSHPSQPQDGQWVTLSFKVPITVRTVRLYNPRFGDEANSSIQVRRATVQLFSDAAATTLVATSTPTGNLNVSGTGVPFDEVRCQSIKVTLDVVTGTFYGSALAALAEIEVIARAE